MELEVWLYFYLIMKEALEQHDSDEIDIERKVVAIGPFNKQLLESGVIPGKLLITMRKVVVDKQPLSIQQLFTLDPELNGMVDSAALKIKKKNWILVRRELKKFGISMEREVGERILSGNHRQIIDLLSFMAEFEKAGGCQNIQQTLVGHLQQVQMTIKVNKSDVGTGTAHQTIAGSTSPTVAALILEKKLPQISFGALSTAQ